MRALVTGSNRGIGLELCRQLAASGSEVFAACRRASSQLNGLNVKVIEGIDVTDSKAISILGEQIPDASLDLLINNAGILHRDSLENLDLKHIREQFEANALAPLALTTALKPKLAKGAKLAFITSRMGSIADNTSGGYYGYRMSKAALNMAAVSLSLDLASDGFAISIIHPGYVSTDMTSHMGNIGPEESAAGILKVIHGLTTENSGSFWHSNGSILPW